MEENSFENIKAYLNLKSKFFDLKSKNDSIPFYGKVQGHWIGKCQKGAKKMAKLGYSFEQVIKIHYRDVALNNRQRLVFFGEL